MSKTTIPAGYRSCLTLYETQTAIGQLKRTFENKLMAALNIKRVSAPLFVDPLMGLNDNLSGVERPVSFDIPATGNDAEVVHSLAKWKRLALKQYGFPAGEGLYTDMNAIRRDEELDALHSIYVDQWDWEKILPNGRRDMDYLKETVQGIISALTATLDELKKDFPQIPVTLREDVTFITTQELEDMYPSLTPKEREDAICKEKKTVFLSQIGGVLRSGDKHDNRAPDYDDWTLNGDILIYSELMARAMEISSMGIRVSPESLASQLQAAACMDRASLPFHKALLNGELPPAIGGGIGQSRVSMLLLNKAHIGEVQVSVWDSETIAACERAGVVLL